MQLPGHSTTHQYQIVSKRGNPKKKTQHKNSALSIAFKSSNPSAINKRKTNERKTRNINRNDKWQPQNTKFPPRKMFPTQHRPGTDSHAQNLLKEHTKCSFTGREEAAIPRERTLCETHQVTAPIRSEAYERQDAGLRRLRCAANPRQGL